MERKLLKSREREWKEKRAESSQALRCEPPAWTWIPEEQGGGVGKLTNLTELV